MDDQLSQLDDENITDADALAEQQAWSDLRDVQKLVNLTFVVYLAIIIPIGIIGNAVCIGTFAAKHMRKVCSSFYLLALSVADLLFLVSLAFAWVRSFGVNIYDLPISCEIMNYISYVCSFLSAWFIVSFTLERFTVVFFPLKCHLISTVNKTKVIVAGVTAFALIFNCWVPVALHESSVAWELAMKESASQNDSTNMSLVDEENQPTPVFRCSNPESSSSTTQTFYNYMNSLDTALTFVIPCCLIFVLNLMIGIRLLKHSKLRHGLTASNKPPSKKYSPEAPGDTSRRMSVDPLLGENTKKQVPEPFPYPNIVNCLHLNPNRTVPTLEAPRKRSNNNTTKQSLRAIDEAVELEEMNIEMIETPSSKLRRMTRRGSDGSVAFNRFTTRAPSIPSRRKSSGKPRLTKQPSTLSLLSVNSNAEDLSKDYGSFLKRIGFKGNPLLALTVLPSWPIRKRIIQNRKLRERPYNRKEIRITKMLLAISAVYLLLNLPSYLFRLISSLVNSPSSGHVSGIPTIVSGVTLMLFYTQYCINFVLYSSHGQIKLCGCGRKGSNQQRRPA